MAINKQVHEDSIFQFLINQNKEIQKDSGKAARALAKKLVDEMAKMIQSADINILTGVIQVQGTPAAQTNVAPIVIKKGLK